MVDWQPGIIELLSDHRNGVSLDPIATKFHNMLVEMIVAVARKVAQPKAVLSGGCFQNRYFLERAVDRLRAEKFALLALTNSAQLRWGRSRSSVLRPGGGITAGGLKCKKNGTLKLLMNVLAGDVSYLIIREQFPGKKAE